MKLRLLLLVFLLSLPLLLTGCKSSINLPATQQPRSCIIIAGRHANANQYRKSDIHEYLREQIPLCTSYSLKNGIYHATVDLTVILCDGKPETVVPNYRGEEFPLSFTAPTLEDLEYTLEDICYLLEQFLLSDSLKANDAETDLHQALCLASEILGKTPNKAHSLLILDTGVVSTGEMSMLTHDIRNEDLSQVFSTFPETVFCDLTDCEVRMIGIGNVAQGQTDVYKMKLSEKLCNFWTYYFKACGATLPEPLRHSHNVGEAMLHSEFGGSYPFVTDVTFNISVDISTEMLNDITGDKGITPVSPTEPLILSGEESGFSPSASSFKNEASGLKVMDAYAPNFQWLKEHPKVTVYVVASVAKTYPNTTQDSSPISTARAQAICTLIAGRYGLSPDQLKPIDAGTLPLFWKKGVEFPNGTEASRDYEAIQMNRMVAVIADVPALSDYIEELRSAQLIPMEG